MNIIMIYPYSFVNMNQLHLAPLEIVDISLILSPRILKMHNRWPMSIIPIHIAAVCKIALNFGVRDFT